MLLPALLSRRKMLALLGAAGLGGCRLRIPSVAVSRWGLQLYTVRDVIQRDFDGTLAAIGTIGYREVETAGYHGRTPSEVRKALDAAGLSAPAAHVGLAELNNSLPALLDACAVIGHKWLVVPNLPRSLATADGYKQAGEQLAKAALAAKSAGVRIAFHNHDAEFRRVGDTNGMEIILASSAPDVAAELDVYWIVKAGGDPFDFVTRHPGRVKMLHVKDASPAPALEMRDVGAGSIDWVRLLPHAEAAGVEHYFVEHDRPGDSMASVKASYDYLKKLGG